MVDILWNSAKNTSRHTTRSRCNRINGGEAQAVDYTIPLEGWTEGQVIFRQVGEAAEHLF